MAPLGPITVAVVSISLVWARSLDQTLGMSIVGPIEAGLPPLTVGPQSVSSLLAADWLLCAGPLLTSHCYLLANKGEVASQV